MNAFDRFQKGTLALYLASIALSTAGMEIFSSLLLLAWIVLLCLRKKWDVKISARIDADLPLLGFLAWVSLGVFVIEAVNPSHRFEIIGSLRWILLLYCARFMLIYNFDFLEKHAKFFTGLILFVATYGVLQFVFGLELIRERPTGFGEGFWRTRGFFGSVMSFSYVFGMIFFFIFARGLHAQPMFSKKNLYPILTTTMLGWALIGTYTRGLWVAVAAGIVISTFYISRKAAFTFMAVMIVVGGTAIVSSVHIRIRLASFIEVSNESNFERLNLWRANWEIFKESPIIGVGFRQNSGHVPKQYRRLGIHTDFISHAHNNYLSVLAGTGVVGFLFFAGFMILFYRKGHRLYLALPKDQIFLRSLTLGSLGAQISFHVGGLTESNFYDVETMHAFALSVAVLYATDWVARERGVVSSIGS